MGDIIGFHGTPASRRHLAKQLREMADIIERGEAKTEPHGIMMVLMGPAQFEVIGVGDCEGWAGARHAMHAVTTASFETIGGNIRKRSHQKYQPKSAAEVTPLVVARKGE